MNDLTVRIHIAYKDVVLLNMDGGPFMELHLDNPVILDAEWTDEPTMLTGFTLVPHIKKSNGVNEVVVRF